MEIRFFVGEGIGIDTMCVEPNSIIKDVLKEFLKRNNYYEIVEPRIYSFKYRGKLLNSKFLIDRRVNNLLIPGAIINFVNQKDMKYSCGEHICPYGCGRLIPDEYKGCTELLQAKPNYFS